MIGFRRMMTQAFHDDRLHARYDAGGKLNANASGREIHCEFIYLDRPFTTPRVSQHSFFPRGEITSGPFVLLGLLKVSE